MPQNAVARSMPAGICGQHWYLAVEDGYGAEEKGVGSCLCVFGSGIRVVGFAVAKGTRE